MKDAQMRTWPLAELKVSVLTRKESDRVVLYDLGEKIVTLKDEAEQRDTMTSWVWQTTGNSSRWIWWNLHLPQSPLVLTLSGGGKEVFCDMASHIPTREVKVEMTDKEINNKTTYEKFLDLYEDVKKNGITDISTISINEDNVVEDGHHRLAILLSLGEKEITLPDSQTVKI